jgi:hypothetical protein
VASDPRCDLGDGFGDCGILLTGAGLEILMCGLLVLVDDGVLVGQAKVKAQGLFAANVGLGSSTWTTFCFFGSSFLPQANMMHRFLPNPASTLSSLADRGVDVRSGSIPFSTILTVAGLANVFVLNMGAIGSRVVGDGGLGVRVLVGLGCPSLVSSAVDAKLPLLQFEALEWARVDGENTSSSWCEESLSEEAEECNV